MRSALYSPGARSTADVRRLEVVQLLSAFEALHGEGIIDGHEYRTKRCALMDQSRAVERWVLG